MAAKRWWGRPLRDPPEGAHEASDVRSDGANVGTKATTGRDSATPAPKRLCETSAECREKADAEGAQGVGATGSGFGAGGTISTPHPSPEWAPGSKSRRLALCGDLRRCAALALWIGADCAFVGLRASALMVNTCAKCSLDLPLGLGAIPGNGRTKLGGQQWPLAVNGPKLGLGANMRVRTHASTYACPCACTMHVCMPRFT